MSRNIKVFIVLLVICIGAIFFVHSGFFEHSNILQNVGMLSYVKSETPIYLPKASLLFVGDMMFDRTIRTNTEKFGEEYSFSCVGDYLKGFDAVVGNLEGPITNSPSVSKNTVPNDYSNTTFTFPIEIAKILYDYNFRAVSIGNNHIFDFGREGVIATKQTLANSGVAYFGDPIDSEHKTAIINAKGLKIALVGYNSFLGVDTPTDTEEEIRSARLNADYVFVYSHWGEEYSSTTANQKILARKFIDAGADAIFGSHPHIIQESEKYKNRMIFYSLGNYIFDQYFNSEVSTGLGVEVIIEKGVLKYLEQHFKLEQAGRTCIMP